jgi:aryl-alcohol dehydrogenase-like predicted oxidoreductase
MKYNVFGVPAYASRSSRLAPAISAHGADPDASTAIFNAYAEAGENFIDTADVYQFGQSEEFLGSPLEGRRENFVLAA